MTTETYSGTKLGTSFWKQYFKDYDVLNKVTAYQELLRRIAEYAAVKPNDDFVDIGAGTGNLIAHLPEKATTSHAVCLDLSPEGLERCKEKFPHVETVLADTAKPLPFADNSKDVVTSNNTLYTIPQNARPAVCAELYRITKPGGTVVVSNLLTHFSPMAIYADHVRTLIRAHGLIHTVREMIRFLLPTIRMMRHNEAIIREHAQGGYDFFAVGEQASLLKAAGFTIIAEELVYAGQAELVVAKK